MLSSQVTIENGRVFAKDILDTEGNKKYTVKEQANGKFGIFKKGTPYPVASFPKREDADKEVDKLNGETKDIIPAEVIAYRGYTIRVQQGKYNVYPDENSHVCIISDPSLAGAKGKVDELFSSTGRAPYKRGDALGPESAKYLEERKDLKKQLEEAEKRGDKKRVESLKWEINQREIESAAKKFAGHSSKDAGNAVNVKKSIEEWLHDGYDLKRTVAEVEKEIGRKLTSEESSHAKKLEREIYYEDSSRNLDKVTTCPECKTSLASMDPGEINKHIDDEIRGLCNKAATGEKVTQRIIDLERYRKQAIYDARDCKTWDIGFGGKGYQCKRCGATDLLAGKIKHVKDEPFQWMAEGRKIEVAKLIMSSQSENLLPFAVTQGMTREEAKQILQRYGVVFQDETQTEIVRSLKEAIRINKQAGNMSNLVKKLEKELADELEKEYVRR